MIIAKYYGLTVHFLHRCVCMWLPLCAVCNDGPTKPDHGAFTSCGATSLPGASCVATCDDGYTAGNEGAPLAVCNGTGNWRPVTGNCTLIGECG